MALKWQLRSFGKNLTEKPSVWFHSYTWVNTYINQAGTFLFLALLCSSSILHSNPVRELFDLCLF